MTLARSLGVERAAILQVEDVGMCHGANRGFLSLAERGFVTRGSVMVPCPWFCEIAEAAAADPALDLGVHLTLTSGRRRQVVCGARHRADRLPRHPTPVASRSRQLSHRSTKDFNCAGKRNRILMRLSRIR
jgi:YdjC-like protein